MRPRLLELTAFGPYPATVRIDFGLLAADGLFVVHGPTGAGKTSLLDAMTYALYGGVSGSRRSDWLRSDHADPGVATSVVLEFVMRDCDYRVTRVPSQERAKKTGRGMTVQKPKATLSVRRTDGWCPLAEGVEEVGRTVTDLLGLNREQFQQVVVLPQGAFARALHADANDRRRLLSSLFHTERFERYTERLIDHARTAEQQCLADTAALATLSDQAADRWTIIAPSERRVDDPVVTDLADQAQTVAAAATDQVRHAVSVAEAADAALSEARLAADRWERVTAATATLAALQREADSLTAARDTLAAAQRAEHCRDLLADVDAGVQAAAAAGNRRRSAAAAVAEPDHPLPEELASAFQDVRGAADSAAVGDDTIAATRDRISHWVVRLESLLGEAREGTAAGRAAAEQEQLAAVHREAADRCSEQHGTAARNHQTLDEQLQAARQAAERLAPLRRECQRLETMAEADARLPQLRRAMEVAADSLRQAKQQHNHALDRQRQLLEERIAGMAAELADQLVEGRPCSVCGATEHPAPAATTGAVVDHSRLEQAHDTVHVAAAAVDDAERQHTDARAALERAEAIAAPGDDDVARLLADCRADIERDTAAAEQIGVLMAAVRTAREQRTAAEQQRAGHLEEAAAAEASASRWTDVAARAATTISDAVGPDVDPVPALAAAQAGLAAVDALCAATREEQHLITAADTARSRLAKALRRHGFDDVGTAESALLAPEEQRRLVAHIAEVEQRRAAAEAVLAETAELQPVAPADLTALTQAKAAADRQLASAQQRLGAVRQAANDLRRVAHQWQQRDRAATTSRAQATQLRRLADVCSGSGNSYRMSLERYVLAAYLEEIAEAATQRLQAMTDGRYSVRHSDERVRGGGASGLSITMHDAFTGTERDPGTLSGGETFQTSLSMALAVADVVQRHAGGVHLDTLFVDEGFGALDPESLEQAMAELDGLRAGGRLVGVISHVPALRERVISGIEVVKTAGGSDARVVAAADV